MTTSPLLTIADLAARLSVSKDTAYRLVSRHAIEAVQVCGSWRFTERALEEFIQRKTFRAHSRSFGGR